MENTAHLITPDTLAQFQLWLTAEDREPGTVQKYARDLTAFAKWLNGAPLTKESLA